jgi:hypothetical protein
MNTSTKQTENDHTIKFTCTENGKIPFNSGDTVFSDLFMIGAFASTRIHKYDGNNAWNEYPADVEGLKLSALKCEEVTDEIIDFITSLGVVLAYADRGSIENKHLDNCAWLAVGLGDLLKQSIEESQSLSHSRLVLSKQS